MRKVTGCLLVLLAITNAAPQSLVELKLPFQYGENWTMTRGYGVASHKSYTSSDDTYALDFALAACEAWNRSIVAAAAGVVEVVSDENDNGYGINLWINHENSCRTRYAHLNSILVPDGANVYQGQPIGLAGNTGNVTGSGCADPTQAGTHLHFVEECSGAAAKPEPMSTYSSFITGQSYTSDNYGPVGFYSDGWHNDGSSQVVLDAHIRSRYTRIGTPKADDNQPQSSIFVHEWNGSPFSLFVQNFNHEDLKKRAAILWRENAAQAFVVRAGFWEQYRYNNGSNMYGAPQTDEGCWTDPTTGTFYQAAQQFDHALMLWNPSMGSQILVRTVGMPTGIIKTSPCGTIQASSFTGSHEKTFKLTATNIAHDQVSFSVMNDVGIEYDEILLYRNGIFEGSYGGNSTGFTDYAVQPNTDYNYTIEGSCENWGTVSVSEAITVTTPPSPGTFDFNAWPRDATTVDLEILDTQYAPAIYNIYRNGAMIARTSGLSFADHERLPTTTYSYQVEATDGNENHIAWSIVKAISTPDLPAPPPETPGPPAEPNWPIRLIGGITPVNPEPPIPVVVNSALEIAFAIQNVGSSPIVLDRVRAEAVCDLGFQTVIRNYPADEFMPTLTLNPGDTYAYQRTNDSHVYPGVHGFCEIRPLYKINGVAGEKIISDIADSASWYEFELFDAYTNPDLTVAAIRMIPVQPEDGDSVTVELDVTNAGDRVAGTWWLNVSSTNGFEALAEQPQIETGQTIMVSTNLGVHTTGVFELGYALDPNDFIHEWNEKNNEGSFYYRIANEIVDSDSDGIPDAIDNCISIANADQVDADSDEFGNACDNCTITANSDQSDTDSDGVGDSCDNCPSSSNATQIDTDADGDGNVCDNCPNTANGSQSNTDGDAQGDACDNCPAASNSSQANSDSDTLGNVCDNCPNVANQNQTDADGDGLGDACDSSSSYTGTAVPSIKNVNWKTYSNTTDDTFKFYSTYTLGQGSDGYDPRVQPVTFRLSTNVDGIIFQETIPENSPHWQKVGPIYTYTKPSPHGLKSIIIRSDIRNLRVDGSYATVGYVSYEADLSKLVTVTFIVGNDTIQYTLPMSMYANSQQQILWLN